MRFFISPTETEAARVALICTGALVVYICTLWWLLNRSHQIDGLFMRLEAAARERELRSLSTPDFANRELLPTFPHQFQGRYLPWLVGLLFLPGPVLIGVGIWI